jgi:glycoprotein-N-acetylgalactosamine 3-beta-galactosyltransferase
MKNPRLWILIVVLLLVVMYLHVISFFIDVRRTRYKLQLLKSQKTRLRREANFHVMSYQRPLNSTPRAFPPDRKNSYRIEPEKLQLKPIPITGDLRAICNSNPRDDPLLRKVQVVTRPRLGTQPVRLLCSSFTYHKAYRSQVQLIKETWGPKCDGYIAMGDMTDLSVPAIGLVKNGDESWNNLWQKTKAIFTYMYDHYLDDYEWFFTGGDDVLLLVENLRLYLTSPAIAQAHARGEPLYLGRRMKLDGNPRRLFNAGGPGYLLNRPALVKFREAVENPSCWDPNHFVSDEDVNIAKCLEMKGVYPLDTRDGEGRERFMPFRPMTHWEIDVNSQDWYNRYSIGLKSCTERTKGAKGAPCMSPNPISFHYMKGDIITHAYAAIYGLCTEYGWL